MKKKFFAVALATTMTMSTMVTAMAATTDTDITGGLGSSNTGDESLGSGDFDVTYTFHNASHDTSLNWNNFAVEVFDAAGNFVTMRADAFGVGAGTGDYNESLGTWGQDQKTTWTGTPEDWAVWATGMADADVSVNVKRAGKVLTFTYDIKAGKDSYKFVGTTPEISALADELSIHLTGEKVNLTNVKFTNNAKSGSADTPADANKETTAVPTDTNKNAETTAAPVNKTEEKATAGKGTPKTGDVAPIAALGAVAVVACAGVVVSRKKVTE